MLSVLVQRSKEIPANTTPGLDSTKLVHYINILLLLLPDDTTSQL